MDSGVVEGSEISGLYDPMVAKLCVWDTDRERARARMLRALDEFEIEGVKTLVGFHKALLRRPCFIAGETCHGVVESEELAQESARSCPIGQQAYRAHRTDAFASTRSKWRWTTAASR